jgi:para-nitrobenzyl esterase
MFLPSPVQDDLLPVRPIDAIRGGSAEGVRLIIGTNMHEGTMFVHPENTGFPNSWTMIAEMLEKNKHADAIPDVVGFYHPSARDSFVLFHHQNDREGGKFGGSGDHRQIGGNPFIRFATDYAFEMPATKVALGQKKYTDDVWMYRYELVTKSGEETGWKASHAFELPAVFENRDFHFSRFVFDGEPEEVFDKISKEMHGAWVRFTKTGDPGPDWGRFEGANSPVRIYDRETRTEQLDRRHLMEIWGDMRFYES